MLIAGMSSTEIVLRPTTTPLSKELERERADVERFLQAAKSENTRKAYEADWREFVAWCKTRKVSACPADAEHICTYLTYLTNKIHKYTKNKLGLSKVERAYSAIAMVQRGYNAPDWPSPRGVPTSVAQILDGIRRTIGRASLGAKDPATIENVRNFLAVVPSGPLHGLRNRAILLVGFFTASRRSELVALTTNDVKFVPEGMIVTIRRSKTDQHGVGYEKAVRYEENDEICAVSALKTWLRAAEIVEGPLFRPIDKQGTVGPKALTDRSVAEIVKFYARKCGLDPELFAGHSLRAGFVTSSAKSGISLDAIMRQTGHTDTKTVRKYIRHATLFDDNAASQLTDRSRKVVAPPRTHLRSDGTEIGQEIRDPDELIVVLDKQNPELTQKLVRHSRTRK